MINCSGGSRKGWGGRGGRNSMRIVDFCRKAEVHGKIINYRIIFYFNSNYTLSILFLFFLSSNIYYYT